MITDRNVDGIYSEQLREEMQSGTPERKVELLLKTKSVVVVVAAAAATTTAVVAVGGDSRCGGGGGFYEGLFFQLDTPPLQIPKNTSSYSYKPPR